MIRRVLSGLAAPVAACALALAHPGHIVSVETVSRQATTIVEGTVLTVESAWSADQTQIYTTVTVEASNYFKGGQAVVDDAAGRRLVLPDRVTFTMLGGTVGDVTLAVLGQPRFTASEHVILFLGPELQNVERPVIGGEHGKLTVVQAANAPQLMVQSTAQVMTRETALQKVRSVTGVEPANADWSVLESRELRPNEVRLAPNGEENTP